MERPLSEGVGVCRCSAEQRVILKGPVLGGFSVEGFSGLALYGSGLGFFFKSLEGPLEGLRAFRV